MDFHIPPPGLVQHGLRAMKMIAEANGVFDAAERTLLDHAQQLFGTSYDLAALTPIEPAELAGHITDPALRRQFVRGMVVLSLIDGEASPEEAALVEAFAGALGVESKDLTALRHLADKSLLRARLDIARRFFAREKILELAREKGLGWLLRSVAALAGVREDAEIAGRFRALEHAPAGSLGRAYFDFVRRNDFTFPGEKGSPPEAVFYHDLTHVLSGYGTDPDGELQVLAFHAGCRREDHDPFSFIMFGIAEFHLGLSLSPLASPATGRLDPVPMFLALRRGMACRIDPTVGWDPWPVIHEPVDALRERYGIA